MKRRLQLLNVALVLLIGLTGWRIQATWKAGQEREQRLIASSVKPDAAVGGAVPAEPAPKTAADYLVVAEKMLFSPDRNPEVVVEVEEPEPMPALPRYYGAMDLGGGPTVILAASPSDHQKSFQLGDAVGDFKLLAVTQDEISFDWKGKTVVAKLADLAPKGEAPKRAASAQKSKVAGPPRPPPPKKIVEAGKMGAEISETMKACVPGENSAPGTVKDGFKKVVTRTPFGSACRWQKVN